MEEKEIIGLDEAQKIAEGFLRGHLRDIRDITIEKTTLSLIGEIIIYDVEGLAKVGDIMGTRRKLFRVQVHARDRTIVGYEA